jgi:hypothetical protein
MRIKFDIDGFEFSVYTNHKIGGLKWQDGQEL